MQLLKITHDQLTVSSGIGRIPVVVQSRPFSVQVRCDSAHSMHSILEISGGMLPQPRMPGLHLACEANAPPCMQKILKGNSEAFSAILVAQPIISSLNMKHNDLHASHPAPPPFPCAGMHCMLTIPNKSGVALTEAFVGHRQTLYTSPRCSYITEHQLFKLHCTVHDYILVTLVVLLRIQTFDHLHHYIYQVFSLYWSGVTDLNLELILL